MTYRKGEKVFCQGGRCDGVFYIGSGKCKLRGPAFNSSSLEIGSAPRPMTIYEFPTPRRVVRQFFGADK